MGFSYSTEIMVLEEFINKLYVYTMDYYSGKKQHKRTNS